MVKAGIKNGRMPALAGKLSTVTFLRAITPSTCRLAITAAYGTKPPRPSISPSLRPTIKLTGSGCRALQPLLRCSGHSIDGAFVSSRVRKSVCGTLWKQFRR